MTRLVALMLLLAPRVAGAQCLQIPNGDPRALEVSRHWVRIGFDEGHPVPAKPPGVTPTIDLSAILAKLDEIAQRNDANTAKLEAAINEPGWFKTVFSNRYVQMGLGAFAGWLGTKAVR